MPNRLGTATSPYLLQHADNPVDWHPWGDAAFDAARVRDVPILLSVGYASCHWCHVMAHESFENAATATLMNDWFVNVKVDREERPDVDRIYMDAVQSMTGRGGWPMTVFLTPQGKPFYAGTYFPPADRHGLPSFSRVLAAIHDAWTARRGEVLAGAERLTSALDVPVAATGELLDREMLHTAIEGIAAGYDPAHGGFGGAPKFPQTPALEFLFRAAATSFAPDALGLLTGSLQGMARGGIHDMIGGGFARYSVDARWLVPHFEKMLYDNALLAGLFARTASLTGDGRYATVARSTFEYLLRDLALPEGGFASGEDADSDGVEGAFYVFSDADVRDAAGEATDSVTAVLGVTPEGNFDGHNVLHVALDVEEVAARFDMDPGELQVAVDATLKRLGVLRSGRNRPALDDKIVTAWNGLAIRALAEGSIALSEPRYLEAAAATARFVLDRLRNEAGRLHRSWRQGRLGPEGFCDDYASLALGCFALYGATGDATWFTEASGLVHAMVDLFSDDDGGGFWATGHDAEHLITRPKNLFDNPSPSDNSLAADALLHMAAYTGEAQWHQRLAEVLRLGGGMMRRHPAAVGHLLGVALTAVLGTTEVAIVGPDRDALVAVVQERPRPTVFLAADQGSDEHPVPLLRHRPVVAGRATAYACRGFVCDLPTNDPGALRAALP